MQYVGGCPAALNCHVESGHGKPTIKAFTHGPTNNGTGLQVQIHDQIQPALAGWNKSDIAHPTPVRMIYSECALEQVGRRFGVARVRGSLESTDGPGHDASLPHQFGDCIVAAGNSLGDQFGMHTGRTIGLPTGGVDCLDVRGQIPLTVAPLAGWPISGRIVSAGRDLQRPAHRLDAIAVPMEVNESMFHLDSRAK
jgi:hypothetical protein